MKNQKLIWVDKEFAEKYKAFESEQNKIELQLAALNDYIKNLSKESKKDFKCNLESIEEEAAIYAGLMLKVRQSFGKAKDKALSASYAIWEEWDKEMPNVDAKVAAVVISLKPITEQLSEIKSLLSQINLYDFDKLLKTVQAIANLDPKSQGIIEFIVKHFGATLR